MEKNPHFEQLLDDTIEKYHMLSALETSDNQLSAQYDKDKLFVEYLNLIQALDLQVGILAVPKERMSDHSYIVNQLLSKLSRAPQKVYHLADQYSEHIFNSYDSIVKFINNNNEKNRGNANCFEYISATCSALINPDSLIFVLLEKNLIDLEFFDGVSFDKEASTLNLNVHDLKLECEDYNLDLHTYASAFTLWINELRKLFWVDGNISIHNISH